MPSTPNNEKIKFHLPDIAVHAKFNLIFLEMFQHQPEFFYKDIEIGSFYGAFPPSMWNGGRTIGGATCDAAFIRDVLYAFNSRGIPLRFTFTNPVLEERHLDDEFCNLVMRLGDNGMNEVIVFSPLLEEYIRTKYPRYKITSSTCKRILEPDAIEQELHKDYHVVVLDYDLNNQLDVLRALPHKEKCELLVNSACIPHCPYRSREYELVGQQQIAYCEHLKQHPNTPFRMSDYAEETVKTAFQCPSKGNSIFDSKKCAHHISPQAIFETYHPMGYNQFKIEGRTASRLFLIECYMYYMIPPECRDEARFLFLHNLERNGLVRIDG